MRDHSWAPSPPVGNGVVRLGASKRVCSPPPGRVRVGCDGETRMRTTGEGVVLERLLSRRGAIVSRLRRKLRCRNDCAVGAIRAVRSRGYRLA